MTFKQWFDENLKDSANDISNNGADAGFSHITYYSDTTILFDRYENYILEKLKETAECIGCDSTTELLQTFNRQDMLDGFFDNLEHDDQSKQLLVWFVCEEYSNELMNEVG